MHVSSIYSLLKEYLAIVTNRPKKQINAGMSLRGNPPTGLGFTDTGLRQLANRLNAFFGKQGHPLNPPLVPSDTQSAQTVRDLFKLIRGRVT